MSDCLFCKIVAGQIPCAKIYEDDEMIAFLDIKPINPGHILIVPKAHHQDLLDTPPDLIASMMRFVPTLGKAMLQATGAEGFNLGVNTGKAAGQVVFHTHVHLMPRKIGDGYDLWHGKAYGNNDEMNKMANAIRAAL